MTRVHDLSTGEVIDREMNDIEFAEYEANQRIEAERELLVKTKATEKVVLLERLGITAEEAALLLA